MSSTPPPSPENNSPLPPRHRPNLDKVVENSTEAGLWALDDLDDLDAKPKTPQKKNRSTGIPAPRSRKKTKTQDAKEPQPEKDDGSGSKVQVNMRARKSLPPAPSVPQPASGPGFEDSDHWDETALPVSRPEDYVPIVPSGISVGAMPVPPAPEAEETVAVEPSAAETPVADETDEFSPVTRPDAVPVSLRPHLKLSKIERIGLFSLLGFLTIGGIAIIAFSLNRLPTSSGLTRTQDFPVEGKLITIETADTYWREPISEGPNAETFRRGTRLLPVLTLTASDGSAAVRVFFRNGDRELIGDAVTRTIQSGTTIEVAATAGFEDIGMHAAYRTGQTVPWTIEIFEGKSENSPGSEFIKLFEMGISTERR
jgi:hypothetical protein